MLHRVHARGFTLLELVMVIVLLGILAATALPSFVNMGRDARVQKILTGEAALLAAANAVHMKVIAAGVPIDATVRQLDVGGGDMVDIYYGYPACSPNGIQKAAGISAGFEWTMGTDPAYCTLYPLGGTFVRASCGVVYEAANGRTWGAVTSGC